jgi:drug/metabolite transporter (DMT)-like permease
MLTPETRFSMLPGAKSPTPNCWKRNRECPWAQTRRRGMTGLAFALVITSGVIHATWNFLVKRSSHKIIFFWTMALTGLVVFAAPAAAFAVADGVSRTALAFGLGTAVLHAVYGISLTRGYYLGDLSSVYPISRGMGPALVPLLAVPIFGETVSAIAWAGIGLVVVGIYATHIDARFWRDLSHPLKTLAAPAARVAIFTGLVISCYSLWDKAGLDHGLPPMTLIAFTLGGNVLGLMPAIIWGTEPGQIKAEWGAHRTSILVAGVLAPLGYTLVLLALTTSQVSYVAPAREVGIVAGAAMGVLWLGEGYGMTRIWGSALIVAGVITLALAP